MVSAALLIEERNVLIMNYDASIMFIVVVFVVVVVVVASVVIKVATHGKLITDNHHPTKTIFFYSIRSSMVYSFLYTICMVCSIMNVY